MRKKAAFFSLLFMFPLVAGFQISSARDSLGHEFNIGGANNKTVVYGSGTARYGRVPQKVEIANHTRLEVCVEGGKNLRYSYRLGGSGGFHPANTGLENKTSERCYSWEISSEYVEENRLQISIWSSNSDGNFTHSPRSRSDSYLQLRYENVTVTEAEETGDKTNEKDTDGETGQGEKGFFSDIISFLAGLI